jgi:hypothetical protein
MRNDKYRITSPVHHLSFTCQVLENSENMFYGEWESFLSPT